MAGLDPEVMVGLKRRNMSQRHLKRTGLQKKKELWEGTQQGAWLTMVPDHAIGVSKQ